MDRYVLGDVDGDGVKERVCVTVSDTANIKGGDLVVLDSKGSDLKKLVLLEDFAEINSYFLEVRDINSDGVLEIIASSPVGAHGEKLYILRWDGESYVRVGEFFSDAPSIEVRDIDADGMDEIVVKQRDYATDAIANSILQIFRWVGGKYQLVD